MGDNIWRFLCVVFAVFLISELCATTVSADVSYQLIKEKRTWVQADRDCRSRDAVLLVLDSHEKVKDFQSHVTLPERQAVWTAAYRMHSPWIWVEGCFSAQFLTKSDGERVVQNQASKCSTICQHTQYAALKGNMCFCLEDMRELQPLDARICDVPCPGAPAEMCGGKGAVSLYSLGGVNGYKDSSEEEMPRETVHEATRSDWRNCVYLLKHETAVWVTADCRKKLPFLCKIYRDEGTMTEYRSPSQTPASWTEARDMCREEGGTLADLHANNMEAVSALPRESEFWVGLYRNTSWAWHVEQTEELPHWCTTIYEDQVGDLHFKTDPCSLPMGYVCQKGSLSASALASSEKLAVYVACGTVAWVLAILTAVLVFILVKKRGWRCRRSGDSSSRPLGTNYFDMDEESVASSRPSRQHSYVNSQSGNQPSCSSPPSCEASDLKPGASKYQNTSLSYNATGNEYATVCMPRKGAAAPGHYEDVDGVGACGRLSSTSTEGDYDLVWDNVKLQKELNTIVGGQRTSTSSENVYAEVAKVTHKNGSRKENDYVTSPQSLFPPSKDFGREVEVGGKRALGRTRSKSL